MPDQPPNKPFHASRRLYGAVTATFLVFALAAGILVGPSYAVPIVVLWVLVMGFFAFNDIVARRNLERHDWDPLAAQDDERETVPSAHLIPDETALGDTAEAHTDLNPHDVPKDAPNRHAVEVQAEHEDGDTTRGDEYGAAGGRRLHHEEAPPSRT